MDYNGTISHTIVDRELKRFSNLLEEYTAGKASVLDKLGIPHACSWNAYRDIIRYDFGSNEELLGKGAESGCSTTDKVVLTLSSICKQLSMLTNEAETELYQPLLIYEEREQISTSRESHTRFVKILPLLHRIKSHINQLQLVTGNAIIQLDALYTRDTNPVIDVKNVHFQVVYEHLGKALATLICFDEIIKNNRPLLSHWSAYKKLVRSVQTDFGKFHKNEKDMVRLWKMIQDLDETLMRVPIFNTFLCEFAKNKDVIASNSKLRRETLTVIVEWCSQVDSSIGEGWLNCKTQALALTALCIFYCQFFKTPEKRIVRSLVALYKKVPLISVCDALVFTPEKYLMTFSQTQPCLSQKTIESLTMHRRNVFDHKIANLDSDLQIYSSKINTWMVGLSNLSHMCPSAITKQDLTYGYSILLCGATITSNLRYCIESVLWLQKASGEQMTRNGALTICRMIECLKMAQWCFHHHTSAIVEMLPHLRQYLSYQLLQVIQTAKDRNLRDKSSEDKFDLQATASTIAESVLWGNYSEEKHVITRITLSVANQNNWFIDSEFISLVALLKKNVVASNIQKDIFASTSTPFVHHHAFLFNTYLEEFRRKPQNPQRIHLMLMAVFDCVRDVDRPNLYELEDFAKKMAQEKEESLELHLLKPVCESIEDELRLSSNPHLPVRNPFTEDCKNHHSFAHLAPLRMGATSIELKEYVEHYLQKVFYNLTMMAPQDCDVYDVMRRIALTIYNLDVNPSHSPAQTVDQVVDILEIVRNIHVFVKKYKYNMHQQFFIEATSKSKYLGVISIRDICNSIHTHGAGIINTTINFSYQFLRKKFTILSEFFFDELIKSPLLKSLKYWKDNKSHVKGFPYEKAEKFNRGIRRLGLTENGLSYLDQLRDLITQIGNTIGFVRSVRSGALHFSSASMQFIPDFEMSIRKLSEDSNFNGETQRNINLLSDVVDEANNLDLDGDYIKILVDAFAPALRSEKMDHLNLFYVIVPALTVNFVEYAMAFKENTIKKINSSTQFTDDGFDLGLSYILSVLDQEELFTSLRWWASVSDKIQTQQQKIEKQLEGKMADTKLEQTLTLSKSRIIQLQREFERLQLGIRSSRVFFSTKA